MRRYVSQSIQMYHTIEIVGRVERLMSLGAYPKNWYTYGMSTESTPKRTRVRTPNNTTTTGFRTSDELWAVLEPFLPVHVNAHRFGGGRPRVSDRRKKRGEE